MNNPKSFWLGWGSLVAAGGIAYYFAKRDINAHRQKQNRPQPLEWWQVVAINEKDAANADAQVVARRMDPAGSPSSEMDDDPAPSSDKGGLRKARGTAAGGRSRGDRL